MIGVGNLAICGN